MYSIIRQGDTDQYDVISLVVDTEADVKDIPTNCAPGSSCLVLEDSSVYILGNDKKWHTI